MLFASLRRFFFLLSVGGDRCHKMSDKIVPDENFNELSKAVMALRNSRD